MNWTAVVPPKPVPVITTEVPTGPLVGLKEAIAGHPTVLTVKLDELVAVPSGVVTEIGPLLAPDGTRATTSVEFLRSKVAETPLKATLVTSLKPDPEIVTSALMQAVDGLNESMVGAGAAVAEGLTSMTSIPITRIERLRCDFVLCLMDAIRSPLVKLYRTTRVRTMPAL